MRQHPYAPPTSGTPEARSASFLARVVAAVAERLTFASVFAVVSLYIFSRFSAEFREPGHLVDADLAILSYFRTYRYEPLFEFAYWVSWVSHPRGQVLVVTAALAYFTVRRRFWPQGATLLLAWAAGGGVVASLKYLFQRPRPDEVFAPLGYSFPSGHTFIAAVVYGVIGYWVARDMPTKRGRRAVLAVSVFLMLLVGWSRVYLGEHFPSDVGAGFAAAIPWVWLCLSLPALYRHPERAMKLDAEPESEKPAQSGE